MRISGLLAGCCVLLVSAHPAGAGECLCDSEQYIGVLLDELPGSAIAECTGSGEHGDAAMALGCFYGLSYKWFDEALPEEKAEKAKEWKRILKAFHYTYEKRPKLRKLVVHTLLTSQAYLDKAARPDLRPLVRGVGRQAIWDALAAASDGEPAALKNVLYHYCADYPVVAQLIQRPAALSDVWPPPPGIGPAVARKRMKCPFMQQALIELGITALDGKLDPGPLQLMGRGALRRLRNAVYARRGRVFRSRDLKDFFTQKPWYKPDPAYDDKRLTDIDRKNLTAIQAEEKKRK